MVTSGSGSNTPLGKILVVDDELELRRVLVESLQRQGYEVTGCGSGDVALAELRARDFDLLLTDLMMPEMDGLAFLKAALENDPQLVGIVITGQGTIQTAVNAMQIGAFDYVLKPFRLENLLPILSRALDTRQLRLENLQLRETVSIHELTQTISLTVDPQTVLSKLTEAALQQTGADEVSVLLPTREGKEFYVAAVRGNRRERLLGARIPFDRSIASWVARERTPLILNGEVNDDRFVALWPRPAIHSSVSVPMLVANKLVGVLNLNVINRSRPFALGQMKALSILACTAAAALESASLYTQVQTTEEKYRTIFENATEGLFQTTSEGRLLTANPALSRILGYGSPEEMVATITDITHQLYVNPEDRAEAARLQEEAGSLVGYEIAAYRKNGEQIWISVNRRSVRNQDGQLIYFEGSVEDITARRQIEEEKNRTRQQYESLVHTIDGIVWELDLQTFTFTFVSKQSERILGYTPEQWLSNPGFWENHLHPDDRSWAFEISRDAAAKRLDHEFDYRMIAADGHVVWLRDIVTVDKTANEHPHLRGVMVDITERKRAEDELKRSEERYRDLVENAQDLIYEHDLEGNYTASNKAGERITGYPLEEILNLNLAKTVAPDYLEKAKEMLRRKLAGEGVTAYDLVVIAKDGHRVPVEVNTRLVLKDGVPVGVQGIARDITERRRLEAALMASEEQLRQSQKLEAIGQLAGGVAHDFNNLLLVIGGYSSIVLEKLPKDSPHLSSIEEIKKASDRAGGLTRQLLAFSRKQILQPKVLDLNLVVTDLEKMLRRLIGEDIDLLTVTDPGLAKVKADPGQIEQVLLNLIVNARDAMPSGGKLTVETSNAVLSPDHAQRHAAIPGSYVMLAVSDTGCGMDASTQHRIFEPFFTTKGPGKGTGLGLATVYGIVKQSGGSLWVYSEVDHGTAVKIYLPRVDEVVVREESGPLRRMPKGTETVLVVEDDEQVRVILTHILEGQGYHVLAASNGDEALSISQDLKRDIKLMITDVVMPRMSGRELAEHVLDLRPSLPVLFMSGYTDDAIVRHGLLDEKLNFINKPFDSASVVRKVREVLDQPA